LNIGSNNESNQSEPTNFSIESQNIINELLKNLKEIIEQIQNKSKQKKIKIKGKFANYFYQIFDDGFSQFFVIKTTNDSDKLLLEQTNFPVDFLNFAHLLQKIIDNEFQPPKYFDKKRCYSPDYSEVVYLENNPHTGVELMISIPLIVNKI
jgi:hypothetical protein